MDGWIADMTRNAPYLLIIEDQWNHGAMADFFGTGNFFPLPFFYNNIWGERTTCLDIPNLRYPTIHFFRQVSKYANVEHNILKIVSSYLLEGFPILGFPWKEPKIRVPWGPQLHVPRIGSVIYNSEIFIYKYNIYIFLFNPYIHPISGDIMGSSIHLDGITHLLSATPPPLVSPFFQASGSRRGAVFFAGACAGDVS